MGFFYDEYLVKPVFDEKFNKETVISVLEKFIDRYDYTDDSAALFDKVKAITEEIGFTTDMKAYKADPDAFPGTVADIPLLSVRLSPGKPTPLTCTRSCRFSDTTVPLIESRMLSAS